MSLWGQPETILASKLNQKEVFIGATAPASPTVGQPWYDTANNVVKVYDGSVWKIVFFSALMRYERKVGVSTDANGLITVTFAVAFGAGVVPVVVAVLEGADDYYCKLNAAPTNTGFVLRVLKTTHTHSFTPAGTLNNVSAGTPSGTISGEASHTHSLGQVWDQGTWVDPPRWADWQVPSGTPAEIYVGIGGAGSGTIYTAAGSSHSHTFTGAALGTHGHTFTGTEGTTGTASASILPTTAVNFHYIAIGA